MQESIVKSEVLESLLNDHSSVPIKICLPKKLGRGSGLWKFNNSLLQDEDFVKELKKHIKEFKTEDTENVLDEKIMIF